MARTATTKRGATKATTRKAAKPAAKRAKAPAKAQTNGRARRTHAELLALVPEIVRKLKAGTTMTAIRAEYGPGPTIRRALMEKGYNTKGQKVTVDQVTGSGKQLAARVAAKRREGVAWYALELATDKTEAELKELLTRNGYGALAEGRVVKEQAEAKTTRKRGTAKTAPKAQAKSATRTRARAGTTKAKTAAPAKKPGRRVARKATASNPF